MGMAGMRRGRTAPLFAGALAALALGCASTQVIPLGECMTEEMVVYVDGRMLDERLEELELRADRPHKLFFKRPGYEPQLVVLEPRTDAEGGWVLEPADPCLELRAVGLDRELTVEVEDGADAPR